jgi:hypothetical protein
VSIDEQWGAWLRKLAEIAPRDGVRTALVTCNLLAPIWPSSLRDDLLANLACLRSWIACPDERRAKACFDRVGRHGFAPLADENFPLPLEVEGVVFGEAAEHAHWAVDEALMAVSSPWFRFSRDSLSSSSHIERSVRGALESLRLASPSKVAPHGLVMELFRAELAIDVALTATEPGAGIEPLPVETKADPIAPQNVVSQQSIGDLASRLAAAFFPAESPTERVVEEQERESVGYAFYRIVVEWRSAHIEVTWTYQRERCMGVDVDDVLTIDVDGSRARIDEGRIEIDRGAHRDALRVVLDAWRAGG